MNKDNARDFLPLVKALAEGKTIQYRHDGGWEDVDLFGGVDFDNPPECYRIKPEPREFTLWIDKNGDVMHIAKNGTCASITLPAGPRCWSEIKVREVLE